MNKKQLQARLEALEQYVYQIDKALHQLEQKAESVSVIFSSEPEEKSLEEVERELDEFIEAMNKAAASYDEGEAPF